MKASIEPRINLRGRTRLETVIPLSTPMTLFVDPTNLCNYKCTFCPTGDRALIKSTGRWQGLMSLETYNKVIDGLKEFDKPLKVLRLYKDGEPFLNPDFAEMVRIASASGVADFIDTTTNGTYLQLDRVVPAIEAGLGRLNISVNGLSDEMFMDLARVKVEWQKYKKTIRTLYKYKGDCEISIKIVGDKLSDEQKQYFYDCFGDYADRVFIENLAPCWPVYDIEKRADVVITEGIYQQEISRTEVCPYIFYSMAVNPDGQVSLCFLDWARNLIIGDLRTQSLKEIWEGEEMLKRRLQHLEGRRNEDPTCGNCGQLTHCRPDNIDPYAEVLAERLLASRERPKAS